MFNIFYNPFKQKKSFTIIEVMIVVIIVSIIAVIGIPSYHKTYRTTIEKEAADQLETIWHAQELFFAKNHRYWPTLDDPGFELGQRATLSQINSALEIDIIPYKMKYNCIPKDPMIDPLKFECAVIPTGNANDLIRITEDPIDRSRASEDPNPCCIIIKHVMESKHA